MNNPVDRLRSMLKRHHINVFPASQNKERLPVTVKRGPYVKKEVAKQTLFIDTFLCVIDIIDLCSSACLSISRFVCQMMKLAGYMISVRNYSKFSFLQSSLFLFDMKGGKHGVAHEVCGKCVIYSPVHSCKGGGRCNSQEGLLFKSPRLRVNSEILSFSMSGDLKINVAYH